MRPFNKPQAGTPRPRNRRHRRWGVAAVEFCICAPIFFYTVFASIEITRIVMIRNLTHDAAYDTARYCMVDGATEGEATANVTNILNLLGTRGVTTTINDGNGLNQSSTKIKVTVAVDLSKNSVVLPWLFSGKTITSTTELKTERYNGFYDPNAG